jgi:hypothetical protein
LKFVRAGEKETGSVCPKCRRKLKVDDRLARNGNDYHRACFLVKLLDEKDPVSDHLFLDIVFGRGWCMLRHSDRGILVRLKNLVPR